MRHILRSCTLATALVVAAPAVGQSPQNARHASAATDMQVRDYVRALTPASVGGQIARFERVFCPSAWGMSPAQNQQVTARLRAVAAAAGVDVGGSNCVPNAMIMVVDDKRSFIQGLARSRPALFSGLSSVDVRRLASAPGPASAWQLEGQVDAAGVSVPVGDASPMVSSGNRLSRGEGVSPDGAGLPINRTTEFQSRISAGSRPAFESAALVVQRPALAGLSMTQVADYAAMRLLVKTDPSRLDRSAPSILHIIDAPAGSEVPVTLTNWDLAFLRGLYSGPATVGAPGMRSHIERTLRESMTLAQAGGN